MITVGEIRRAQTLIQADDNGLYLVGNLVDIQAELLPAIHKIEQKHRRIYQYLNQITFDIWNLGTLLARIEWTRRYAIEHKDFVNSWRKFVSVDIGHFHVEFRSIFDYAANIFRLVADKPGSVPQKSYRKLYDWLVKVDDQERHKRVKLLGQDASSLVTSTSWFMDFRNLRDSMIHRGSFILVFGEPEDGTLFQIYDPNHISTKVKDQFFLVDPNVADFELYSALWMTRLILFLEDFATIVSKALELKIAPNSSKFYSGGLDITHLWMDKLVSAVSDQE